MKQVLLVCLLIGSFQLMGQNIGNSSFEDWTFGGVIQKPTGWSTSNEFTALQGNYTVEPDSNSFAGLYSVHIKTIDIGTPAVPYPGYVVNGLLTPNGKNDFGKLSYAGEAFPYKPFKLIAYYKFTSNAPIEDWAYAYVLLKKYDINSNTSINIGFGSNTFLNPSPTFKYFEVPISYMVQGVTPDSIVVAFFSSYPQSPISGGELWVDKISFDYTGSINENKNDVKIYPNPVKDYLIIESLSNDWEYNIYNIHGQKIRSAYTNDLKTSIDTKEMKKGIYLIMINSPDGKFTQTFIKE
ncbi:MAG: T9SS type A sorting domain-containing protein [Bacteroidetes bacterium]|nr:T9SS type A sorting domain-containing protein [Bacteroidota bacterium]MBT4337762.1 T9SS type A sorting domain-containing protein [Bacteroidota bacterium]